ncbi:hypothetical protein PR202_gb14232 [Eleusine coracana subsp. coracana]|uniref:BTB domain-containing protein n=1 Tax=Eleusine coracana subsp. coracana TaxID=191504 RepID=A0AAV5EVS1_ELECO|nr:hypothetical protein PR202_gb14232 [Eleusine coracana subsp. coracana]
MAASLRPGPRRKTMSRCSPEIDRCVHVFEIDRYSLHKGSGAGRYIRSASFAVGGHDWCVCVREILAPRRRPGRNQRPRFHLPQALEQKRHRAVDDRLVIECDVTVIMKTPVPESGTMFDIEVPPSDLSDNLGKLLETQKGTDVTFKVKHEFFHAHKIVLAMRSRVFEAQIYGPLLGDNDKPCVTIEDMEPSIFKTLLHFIYTDSLPATVMDDLDGDEKEERVKHLLVAADRYAMERMKLMCESMLCKRLSAESVHHCSSS